MNRRVLVLNQFALPRSSAGGTRHVEIFSIIENWQAVLLVGRKNMHDQGVVPDEGILETVPVTPYSGNGISRVLNWCSYTLSAGFFALRRGHFDAVYGSSPHLGAAVAGLAIAKLRRVPFVLEIRDLWPQILSDAGILAETSTIYRMLSLLERMLYRQADAIVVLANGTIGDIVAHGIPRSKIHFVPNGADPDDFEVQESKTDLRRKYGLGGDPVAVYAGAHGPANGLDFVLDAAKQLADAGVAIRIVLVGDGVAKADLRTRVKNEHIDNVTFLDPIPKSEIPMLFAAADIGLHSLADIELFHRGVSPNKLYDYMAAGLPVITNTPGEVSDLVREAQSGEAVAPTSLAEGLARLLALSDAERAQLGHAGRTFMSDNRSRRAMAEKIGSLLDGL